MGGTHTHIQKQTFVVWILALKEENRDKIAKPETREQNWPIKPLLGTQMVSNQNTITPEVTKFIPPVTLAKPSVTQVSRGVGHSHRGRKSWERPLL